MAGVLTAATGLLVPIVLALPRAASGGPGAAPRVGNLVSAALTCLVTGIALILIGVGAVRLRRWVRPLILTAATITSVIGVVSVLAMLVAVPAMRQGMIAGARPGTPPPPSGVLELILACTIGFMALVFVVIPGAYLWLYQKPVVKQMLEYYDPVPRWTDRHPLPVLGLAVGWAMAAGSALLEVPQAVAPVFGTVLFGAAGSAAHLAEAAAAAVVGWLVLRRRRAGWWGSLALIGLWILGAAATQLRPDRFELYRRAGYSAQELNVMRRAGATGGLFAGVLWLAASLLPLGYVLYVRRYFFPRPPAEAEPGGPTDAVPVDAPSGPSRVL